MSWTKRQIITEAFEELGLASYVFDLQSEQLQTALRRLDVMMASWNDKGIRIGFPLVSSPEDSDLDTETGVTDMAIEAIVTNLALRLAPGHGKTVSRETKRVALNSFRALVAQTTKPNEMVIQDLPSGAGNKSWRTGRDTFITHVDDTLDAGDDDTLDFS